MRLYRYSRWDGTQEIEAFTPEDVMEHIADDLLDDGSLRSALRRMLQHGADFSSGRRMMGLQELIDRLRQARAGNLDRYNLGSVLDDIVERLDRILDTERQGIRHRHGEEDEPADGAPGDTNDSPAEGSPDAGQRSAPGQQGQQAQAGQMSSQ